MQFGATSQSAVSVSSLSAETLPYTAYTYEYDTMGANLEYAYWHANENLGGAELASGAFDNSEAQSALHEPAAAVAFAFAVAQYPHHDVAAAAIDDAVDAMDGALDDVAAAQAAAVIAVAQHPHHAVAANGAIGDVAAAQEAAAPVFAAAEHNSFINDVGILRNLPQCHVEGNGSVPGNRLTNNYNNNCQYIISYVFG